MGPVDVWWAGSDLPPGCSPFGSVPRPGEPVLLQVPPAPTLPKRFGEGAATRTPADDNGRGCGEITIELGALLSLLTCGWLGTQPATWPKVLALTLVLAVGGLLVWNARRPDPPASLALQIAWPAWASAGVLLWGAALEVWLVAAAVGGGVAWAARCIRARPDPALSVWGPVVLGLLAGVFVCRATQPAPVLAPITLLVLAVLGLHQVTRSVCPVVDDWILSLPGGVARTVPGLVREVRPAIEQADQVLRLAATAVVVALSGAGGLVQQPLELVQRVAIVTLLWSVSLALLVIAATLRSGAAAVLVGLSGSYLGGLGVVTAAAWSGPIVGYLSCALGLVLLAVAAHGGRTWDLLWWPVPHRGVVPWLLALSIVCGVVASGAPAALAT